MNILLIAEIKEGWTFSACKRALLRMGHPVEVFNVGDITFPMSRSLVWRMTNKVSRAPAAARVNGALQRFLKTRDLSQYDLILFSNGECFPPATIRKLKVRTRALLFNWQTDDCFSRKLSSPNALRSIPLYDCIFAHAKANLPKLTGLGARRAESLPHGADPDLYHPLHGSRRDPFTNDVLFMGNWRKERAAFLEKLVSRSIPYRLAVWGYQWEHLSGKSPLRACVQFKAAPWKEYGPLIRRSKINLVFLVRFDTGLSVVPLRLFEIPAAGGFMLVEKGDGQAEEFFQEGKEMACFQDDSDLREKIDYFLRHEEERRGIALAGQRRAVQSGYFYANRMERILQVYREIRQGP